MVLVILLDVPMMLYGFAGHEELSLPVWTASRRSSSEPTS